MEFYIVHFISLTKDYLSYQDDYFASRQFMNMALKDNHALLYRERPLRFIGAGICPYASI